MTTLINNEGKKVIVSGNIMNDLYAEYKQGTWMAMIKIEDNVHMIPLPDNFHNYKPNE